MAQELANIARRVVAGLSDPRDNNLHEEVEQVLISNPVEKYGDHMAMASLIVSVVGLAWKIATDLRAILKEKKNEGQQASLHNELVRQLDAEVPRTTKLDEEDRQKVLGVIARETLREIER